MSDSPPPGSPVITLEELEEWGRLELLGFGDDADVQADVQAALEAAPFSLEQAPVPLSSADLEAAPFSLDQVPASELELLTSLLTPPPQFVPIQEDVTGERKRQRAVEEVMELEKAEQKRKRREREVQQQPVKKHMQQLRAATGTRTPQEIMTSVTGYISSVDSAVSQYLKNTEQLATSEAARAKKVAKAVEKNQPVPPESDQLVNVKRRVQTGRRDFQVGMEKIAKAVEELSFQPDARNAQARVTAEVRSLFVRHQKIPGSLLQRPNWGEEPYKTLWIYLSTDPFFVNIMNPTSSGAGAGAGLSGGYAGSLYGGYYGAVRA
jgi:hypothetical protein